MSKKQRNNDRRADVIASGGGRVRHKKRKRIRLNIPSSVVVTFGITSALVIVVLLAFTMFFNVKSADITGSELYTYDQILVMSGVTDKTNLLRMDTGVIEQRLVNGLPYVEEAKVTKKFPDSVKIELKEASQRASLENNGRYMIISGTGIVLETDSPVPAEGCPIIAGFEPQKGSEAGKQMESEDNLKAKIVSTLLECIDDLGYDKVSNIDISDRTNIVLKYDDRIDIYIGSSYDMEFKLEQIKLVIDKGVTKSFRGMLRYNGAESGITELSEDAIAKISKRAEGKSQTGSKATQQTDSSQQGTEQQTQPAEPAAQTEAQQPQQPAETEAPAVTTAPPETTPPPETTTTTAATTWNGW